MKFAHVDLANKTVIKKLRQHPRADEGEVTGLIPGTAIVPIEFPPMPAGMDTRLQNVTRVETVTPTAVVMAWFASDRTLEEIAESIKQESRNRILQRFPIEDLVAVLLDQVDKPTSEEKAEAKKLSTWTKSIRKETKAKLKALDEGKSFDIDEWPEFPA